MDKEVLSILEESFPLIKEDLVLFFANTDIDVEKQKDLLNILKKL
jgi:hypothetical protein